MVQGLRWIAIASSVGLVLVAVGWAHTVAQVPDAVRGRVGGEAIEVGPTEDGWAGFAPVPEPPQPAPFDYERPVRCDHDPEELMRFAASKSGLMEFCWETVRAGTIPEPAQEVVVW